MSNYVKGYGSSSAKILVALGRPTYADDRSELPAQGQEGRLLDTILKDAGSSLSQVYVTHILKRRPVGGLFRNAHLDGITSVEKQCMPEFWSEVNAIKPNVILALGEAALFFTTGHKKITNYRGSILRSKLGTKVVASYTPESLLFSRTQKQERDPLKEPKAAWSAKTYMTLDYRRAIEESLFPDIRLPSRTLEIARNSAVFYQFLERYKDKKKVALDIEVINCIPVCIALAFTPFHAMSVPLINIPGANNFQIPHGDLTMMWKLLARMLNDPLVGKIGQNFKFDHEKLERPCGFRIQNVISDVMFKAHALHGELPKKLGFTTSIYTKEPYYKDEGKEFNPGKDNIDKFYLYNAKDAAVTFEIDEKMEESLNDLGLSSFYYDFLMQLHPLYMEIERKGFHVNREKKQELIMKYGNWRIKLETELNELVGRDLPSTFINSPIQQKRLLYEELAIPVRESVDEDTLCALLANTVKDPKERKIIENIYTQVRVKKAEGNMRSRLDYDKRMRTSFNIVGTETGRRTTGNLDAPVRFDKMGFPFQIITKHGEFGTDMRYIYEPDEGKVFQNFDLSQAEARIVALLSEDYELLESFGVRDIHKMTASWIFKKEMESVSDEERFCGKTCRHAGNYDMGKRRHMLDITKKARRFHIDISISEQQAGQNLIIFHKNSPKIRGIFHEEVKRAITDNHRILTNPFGRKRIFFDRMGNDLHREAYAFIPQSTVSDHLAKALLRIKARIPWLEIIVDGHDAILVQTLEGDQTLEARAIITEEFEKPIDFGICSLKRGSLVIPSDCEIGFNYKDMRKVKRDKAA